MMSKEIGSLGVAAIRASKVKLRDISNNLANAQSIGFKKSDVNLIEGSAETYRAASKPEGRRGGINPQELGSGPQVGSIKKIFTQGDQISTGGPLDFMISGGNSFFCVENSASGMQMLTKNGRFGFDDDGQLVDGNGNRVLGRNLDPATGKMGDIDYLKAPPQTIQGSATTEIKVEGLLNTQKRSRSQEIRADSATKAWEIFSGGENFGKMKAAVINGSGKRADYADGYYHQSTRIATDVGSFDIASPTQIDLTAAVAISPDFMHGFKAGNEVQILDKAAGHSATAKIHSIAGNIITLDRPLNAGGLSFVTNLTDITVVNAEQTSSKIGSSGGKYFNDVLDSQVSLVDDQGRLIANFFRTPKEPQGYQRGSVKENIATPRDIMIGSGEFSSMGELKNLILQALADENLTYVAGTNTKATGTIDNFGAMSFSGSGLASTFHLVVNADNTEMRKRLGTLACDPLQNANTQAVLGTNGMVKDPAAGTAFTASRAGNSSEVWYMSDVKNYGYSSTNPSTEYGHAVGLHLSSKNNPTSYGVLTVSIENALGQTVSQQIKCVPRNPDSEKLEFSTMGQLASLVDNLLKSPQFSTKLDGNGNLIADSSATCTMLDGRLSATTTEGIFNKLTIKPENTDIDPATGVIRTDDATFGSILGAFYEGINGSFGCSNKMVEADALAKATAYDSQGNSFDTITYIVQDRSLGEESQSIEFKTQVSANVNSNYEVTLTDGKDKEAFVNSFNRIADNIESRGVLGFTKGGSVYSTGQNGDARYRDSFNLELTPYIDNQTAEKINIKIDFSKMVCGAGLQKVEAERKDGYPPGELELLRGDSHSGAIQAKYSNGKEITACKIGIKTIRNPEGLEKVGQAYYRQTTNSQERNQIETVDAESEAAGRMQPKIIAGALEASNVEMIEELTNMMEVHRFTSASGKIISTGDEILQEIINLKR